MFSSPALLTADIRMDQARQQATDRGVNEAMFMVECFLVSLLRRSEHPLAADSGVVPV